MLAVDTETRWGLRIGAALLLVLVHLGVWRPVREGLTAHVAFPLLEALATPRAEGVDLVLEPRAIAAEDGTRSYRLHAPAGLAYLVTALGLVLAFPRRLYWLWLWLALLVLGIVTFAAFALGIGWTKAGFAAADLGQLYLAPALCLLALVVPFIPGTSPGSDRP